MSENTVNEARNDGGSITGVLPEASSKTPYPSGVSEQIKNLLRIRTGHPAAHHISTLIQQLRAWDTGDRGELRRTILGSVERLERPHILKE